MDEAKGRRAALRGNERACVHVCKWRVRRWRGEWWVMVEKKESKAELGSALGSAEVRVCVCTSVLTWRPASVSAALPLTPTSAAAGAGGCRIASIPAERFPTPPERHVSDPLVSAVKRHACVCVCVCRGFPPVLSALADETSALLEKT